MKKFLMALAVLCIASPAIATGPNAGGTLVVHDTGVHFSTVSDLPIPPPSAAPTSCPDGVDNSAPEATSIDQVVWKVYAAFTSTASPRVKGVAWGITGTGPLYVTTAGLPDPPNCFQVVQGSWPSPPGSIGQSWVYTQTSQFVECYWFGGYGYSPAVFSTAPHSVQESAFVDDATPGNTDLIAGFSSMGFGVAGSTVCPVEGPVSGACCHPDGTCEVVPADTCLPPNNFVGGDCLPGLCPVTLTGACCFLSAGCQVMTEADCLGQGGSYQGNGVPCVPDPCPTPTESKSWGQIKANYR
jgi:hypothetical protein